VRRVSFRVPADDKEALLDALMPLLPAGVRERELDGGDVELTTVSAAPPPRAELEAAAGRELAGWEEDEVPADWRERRARFGGSAFLVGDRLLVRSPWDPPAEPGVLDLVLERGGGGFGSGSHATTRMCLELLLELEPDGGAADLGCGLGTLAIAAARLGWSPVAGVDRMAGAVEAARANGARNEVAVDWRVGDLESEPVPLADLLLVNAPPPVHARVAAAVAAGADAPAAAGAAVAEPAADAAAAAGASAAASASAAGAPAAADAAAASASGAAPDRVRPRHIVVSGVVPTELDAVARDYAAAGWAVVARREQDGWAAALLEPAGA
jgi:ribosomal protein L11 methyltransferase